MAVMSSASPPIPFAGSSLREYRHVCAFFESAEEEYRTLLPFIREGLALGERAFHIIEPRHRQTHLRRLREAGIDVDETQATRQLEVLAPSDTYLRKGHFDQDDMIELIQAGLRAGRDLGFPLTRLIAHAESVLEDSRGADEWVEYETRLNYVLPRHADPVICTYDSHRLGAATGMDILRTHPVVIVGGVLHENPFFMPPDDFLEELEGRRRLTEAERSY